jgi:hypothetical protein
MGRAAALLLLSMMLPGVISDTSAGFRPTLRKSAKDGHPDF